MFMQVFQNLRKSKTENSGPQQHFGLGTFTLFDGESSPSDLQSALTPLLSIYLQSDKQIKPHLQALKRGCGKFEIRMLESPGMFTFPLKLPWCYSQL
jgi:hypothetical protein